MSKTWVNFKDVRARLNFKLVLSHYDIKQGKGADFKIPCPFHDDKKPSCSVNTDKKIFNCFSCGTKGNILDFVTLMNGGDPKDMQDVRRGALFGLELLGDSPKKPAKKARKSKPESKKKKKQGKPAKKKKRSQGGSTVANATFGDKTSYASANDTPSNVSDVPLEPLTFSLKLNPSHEYMRGRGINKEMAERHEIGYCNRGMMKGRVCFPLKNAEGQLVAYSGRYVDTAGEIPEDMSRYKLPKGFPKGKVLYGYDRVSENLPHIFIVEGFWSAIRFDEAGIPALATMGATLTSEQADLIALKSPALVTVIFDGDEAGRVGMAQALFELTKRGLVVNALHLNDGEKPDVFSEQELAQIAGVLPSKKSA